MDELRTLLTGVPPVSLVVERGEDHVPLARGQGEAIEMDQDGVTVAVAEDVPEAKLQARGCDIVLALDLFAP
ncbi:hypothetical protein [Streptomyces sp. NPDC097640]|uniref:hypothetical protein n=1 Tax=Streptomyces sp. NPDC097640 TaxID=3157229 RepID=UPI00332CB014